MMTWLWLVRMGTVATTVALLCAALGATPPPREGPMPDVYLQRIADGPTAFTYKRALIPMMTRILQNRQRLAQPPLAPAAPTTAVAAPAGRAAAPAAATRPSPPPSSLVTQVTGKKSVPVLLVSFKDTKGGPSGKPLYSEAELQKKLFSRSVG